MWIVYLLLFILAIVAIYVLAMYNGVIKLENMADEAFSTMDVYLKKRWDLIPSLVEAVKGYAKHEKNTLKEVTELRKQTYDDLSMTKRIRTNESLSRDVTKIMALAEDYPKLKASENFQKLSDQLVQVEDEIANSRKYYNAVVRLYNNKVEVFPNSIIAKIAKCQPRPMFETDEEDKKNVKVKL